MLLRDKKKSAYSIFSVEFVLVLLLSYYHESSNLTVGFF